MGAVQSQLRADIYYLVQSWKAPKLYPVNGDISKDKSFAQMPALLSFLKPEESKPGTNKGKIQTWRIELFLVYTKLPDNFDMANRGHEYDEQSGEMCEILDKIHTGLTKQYIAGKKNPIAHSRGYAGNQPLQFLDTYFEFGSNKYMAVRATWSMNVPVNDCFDCTDYIDGTFEAVNVPPYNTDPIGGQVSHQGDLIYWNAAANNWNRLSPGNESDLLQIVNGVPKWVAVTVGGGVNCDDIAGCAVIQTIQQDIVTNAEASAEADIQLQNLINEQVEIIENRITDIESWAAADISSTQITNWNTAYGWGNHASAGYLTSAPVSSVNSQTGAVVLTTTHISEGTNLYFTNARAIAQVTATNFSGTMPLSKGGTGTTTGLPINNLIAATGAATLNHAANAQGWQWNSLAGGTGFKLSAATTAAAGNTQKLLEVALSGANTTGTQTTYGSYVTNTHTGTSSTNVAGYFSASGGTNNYALIVEAGFTGIGTATPRRLFHLHNSAGTSASFQFTNATTGQVNNTTGAVFGIVDNDLYIQNYQVGIISFYNQFTETLKLTSDNKVSIGVTSPTATLHIKAGTATANTAPLKFTSGTNLTTAEAGAMEYNGTNLFFTRSGTTRENIVCASAVNTVSPTSPNRTITVNINGTTYYLHAKTTND